MPRRRGTREHEDAVVPSMWNQQLAGIYKRDSKLGISMTHSGTCSSLPGAGTTAARRFNRSVSWVSRRLAPVDLPPKVIQRQVQEGALRAEPAMKYLVPGSEGAPRVNRDYRRRMAAALVRRRPPHRPREGARRLTPGYTAPCPVCGCPVSSRLSCRAFPCRGQAVPAASSLSPWNGDSLWCRSRPSEY